MATRYGWAFHDKDKYTPGDRVYWDEKQFSHLLVGNSLLGAFAISAGFRSEQLSFWEVSGRYKVFPHGTENEKAVCLASANIEPELRKFLGLLCDKVEKTDYLISYPYRCKSDLDIASAAYPECEGLVSAIGGLCDNMFLHTDRENGFRMSAIGNHNYANSWCEVEFAKVLAETVPEFHEWLEDAYK